MVSILRWTSADRALKMITKRRKPVTAADFNQVIRDYYTYDWIGHIGDMGKIIPSCGCPSCTRARFDMRVK